MKKLLSALLVITAITAFSQQTEIKFGNGTWEDEQAAAKESDKPLFVFAYATHCHFCKEMEAKIFPDQDVSNYYNATFLNYKIDIEKGQGLELAKQYNINGYPTYLYFDKNGKLLHISGGSKAAGEFIQDGKNAFDPNKAYASLKEKYEKGERAPEFLYEFSNAVKNSNSGNDLFSKLINEYLQTQTTESLKSKKNLEFIFDNAVDFNTLVTNYYFQYQKELIALKGEKEINSLNRRIFTSVANDAGYNKNTGQLNFLHHFISSKMQSGNEQWKLLVDVYYFLGIFRKNREAWQDCAKTVLNYAQKYAAKDNFTLREVATYIFYFTEDKKAHQKGAEIIAQAIGANKTYDNLLLQAKLFHKLGNEQKAEESVNEAISLTDRKGLEFKEAIELLNTIKHSKK